MNEIQIKNIRSGVGKYQAIMGDYWNTDVTRNARFQKQFNGFYRIRQRAPEWYAHYYEMLEAVKSQDKTFLDLLTEFNGRCDRVEASFISKLYATRNPEYPIIDTWVLKNIGLALPHTYALNRIAKIDHLYQRIVEWYAARVASEAGRECVRQFDAVCPDCLITAVKKIDFILWQSR
ncbi:MAG: hypothetical protein NC924_02845 [Candidatus Omnitrophica bacterium]|nr:hypothetical protein [Candidatus Omnitrophota bacterium]